MVGVFFRGDLSCNFSRGEVFGELSGLGAMCRNSEARARVQSE